MTERDFWYVVAESKELNASLPLSRTLLDEWVVIFRDHEGKAVALQDRCLHRGSQLSKGRVVNGHLQCSYHGWTYGTDKGVTGLVTHIPSEGPVKPTRKRCAVSYAVKELQGYIYVNLGLDADPEITPFEIPHFAQPGYASIRLQNLFHNTVTNCAENFVDIPHTTFVHPNIFRNPQEQKFGAVVERNKGHVKVTYKNETKNFGWFSWFLNPAGHEVIHTDEFFMPNVTCVQYRFHGGKHFIITSQSIPISKNKTLVYTDLTYNYGLWNHVAKPIIRYQAQKIIDQDIEILDNQMLALNKYGASFQNSPCDVIHTYIESIQEEISAGRDPRALPDRKAEVEFWV
ncbi:MAG: aromatic ring-hydroxylating dioxygenase subunit alpha [Bdellovibrionales bacterium]|nr:aromatic ring-hydroxylating dioxygenase subunit alpha [Bdellovibrionales bacterium]